MLPGPLRLPDFCFIHPPEDARIVQYDAVFIHGNLHPEATAVEVLEAAESVGQPCIGLRLWVSRQVRREDPRHAELQPLTDSHRLVANRKAVGERGRPDIDIHAASDLVNDSAVAVPPVTPPVRLQIQRSWSSFFLCFTYRAVRALRASTSSHLSRRTSRYWSIASAAIPLRL